MLRIIEDSTAPHSARVRQARRTDAASLATLHVDALAERLGYRGGSLLAASVSRGHGFDEVAETYALHTTEEHVEVLIAELTSGSLGVPEAGEPLGHVVIRFGEPGPDGRGVASIEELYVTPPARNIGLGSALLEGARKAATARGCTGIDAVTLPGDRATKNFFEDHGMVARAIIVHAELPSAVGDDVGAVADHG